MPTMEPFSGRTIAQQELVYSLRWLINMRWIASAGVVAGTAIAAGVLRVPIAELPLYLLGFTLFAYNLALKLSLKWLDAKYADVGVVFQWFARTQIGLDWLGMAVLIHYSGGVESPAILFFLFHITIASLLLPHDRGFLYVTMGPALVGGVALAEYSGLLPHVYLVSAPLHQDRVYVMGVFFFFTCASYVMAYVSMSISRRLRRREDEVAGLYQGVEATLSSLDFRTVLDKLTEATARVLNCKGASVRLLDQQGRALEMVTAWGLSPGYLEKAPIDLRRALIDQEALSGKTVLVTDAANDPRMRYPDKIRAEGIVSILSTPLIGKTGPLGVLRAYGDEKHQFSRDDAAFLAAVASYGAVAIENARTYQMRLDIDREKSLFLRTVTHELRSPLNAVASILGVLRQVCAGDLGAKQADLVSRALQRVNFLQTLVDDLLDLAAGKAEVLNTASRERVSLTGSLREACARFEPQAQAKGLELLLFEPGEDLTIWGDRSELERVLTNLLSNAVKYTQRGEVRVSLERHGEQARLTVADTGIGIPKSAMSQLFEEFFRAPNAKAMEERGTGLGLAIIKDLVARYGGTISAESTEGQGSAFTLLLPLASAQVP